LLSVALAVFFYRVAYNYNVEHVLRTNIDSEELFYPNAMLQLLSGVYGMELGLILLLAVTRGSQGEVVCGGQAFAAGALLVCTLMFHYCIHVVFMKSLDGIFPVESMLGSSDSAPELLTQRGELKKP